MSATMRSVLQTVPESLAADHVTQPEAVPAQQPAPQKARPPAIAKVRVFGVGFFSVVNVPSLHFVS